MNKTQDLNAKIEELQKIARGLESGDIMPSNESNGSPEDVMELVEEAVELLEEVKEITPAEESHEMAGDRMPEVDSLIAKVKQAVDGEDDDDKEKDDDSDDDKEKDAKTKVAETQGDRQQEDDDDDEADFKKEARKDRARLAFLEEELESRKRIAIAESAGELYPENIRSAEVEKLADSKGSNRALEAKIKFAKDVVEKQNVQKSAYRKVTESQGGYLTKRAKQVIVPAWRT